MASIRQKIILGHLLLLAVGALIGWLYGHADWGLLGAALIGLGWQLRQLLTFERALQTRDFESLRYGEGIWSHFYARISHMRQRSKLHKKRYRKLVKDIRMSANALPDGGIILNEDFEIVLCNVAAQDLVGFERHKDRGQRVDNILRAPAFSKYLQKADFAEAVEVPSPVRENGWLSCRIVPYGAGQWLLLIRDITERRRLSTMRREFVANASHELRSPLTVISGYLDTLVSDRDAPDEWQQPLQQMQIQAARMNKIVAELLELSRLEGAGAAPEDEVVDVAGLLAAAKKTFVGRPDVPRIELDIQSHARLQGSGAELESTLDNLLSNALRYTPAEGLVTLRWSSNADGAELAVQDTGIGIEPEHLPRLTERFFRVDPGRDRQDGGVGLGLAIVKHVLERHGGSLEVASEPGEGSVFTCRFPAERVVMPDAIPMVREGLTVV